ncbi:MAG: biotin/lipoyl-containing protein [Myxococcota bacterium]|nr:biotin/lipoyl-containing protein [Myxococcota bacterium]
MATYKVRSNGIEHTVNVLDNPGGGATVTVDDEHEFQVEFTGGEVETATPVKTSAKRPSPAIRPAPAALAAPPASSAAGPGGVISPMPGKVISVKVAVGDAVAENDVVLSLEAMKMENNIVAHIAGSVARIEVSEGSEVAAGALLLVIEP